MRRKGLYTVIFNLAILHGLLAQTGPEVRAFADEQLEKGNVRLALKEYQRVLLFDEQGIHNDLYGSIAGIHFRQESYGEALRYYDMAWNAAGSDSSRHELIFQKARCHFRQREFYLALSELLGLPDSLGLLQSEKRAVYLGICYFGLNELDSSLDVLSAVTDSCGFRKIDSLYRDYKEFQRKYDPDRLEIMSIFLPGLGQLYAGEPLSAVNSFLLLAATAAYSYYTALTYSILDGILFFTSWSYRYYTGGHKKAYEIGIRLQEEYRYRTYRELLDILPGYRPASSGST